jgi:putative tricarboxylic transport membrane protein
VIEGESILTQSGRELMAKGGWGGTIEGVRETFKRWWHVVWTSLIGLIIGVVPGAGAAIASFVAYQQSRTFSKTPELYGTGHIEGLIAPESANNGVTSGTLIPLLVIGVPGGATAAIMAVVLQYHGITVGPDLFMNRPELAYGPFTAMTVTYLLMILTVLPLARYMSHVTVVSTVYMAPIIIAFTLVGAFVPREYTFDMYLALAFGVIGYVARKTGYHVAAILIGVILGPLLEQYFLRALRIAQGDVMVVFSTPLGNILWCLLALSLAIPYVMEARRKKARSATPEPT